MKITPNVKNLTPDPIRKWITKHKELGTKNMFTIGVPDLISTEVLETFTNAIVKENKRRDVSYPSINGDVELRKNIIRMENNFGTNLSENDMDHLFVTIGASHALHCIFSLLKRDTDVLVNTPYWGTISNIIAYNGLNLVPVRFFEGGKFIEENANAAITKNTTTIFINIPSNPVGSVIPKPAMSDFVDWALSKDLHIIEDSPYKYMIYDKEKTPYTSPSSISEEANQNTTLIGTFSKILKPDIRLGFMRVASSIIQECNDLSPMPTSFYFRSLGAGAPRAIQAGVNAIISKDPGLDFLKPVIEGYKKKMGMLVSYLEGIGCTIPEKSDAGFFVLPRAPEGESGEEFVLRMVKEHNMGFIPGTSFGGLLDGFEWIKQHFRASVGGGLTVEALEKILGS